MTTETPRRYRAKITQNPLTESPPDQAMPVQLEYPDWQPQNVQTGPSLGLLTLLFGGLFAFAYGSFQAVAGLIASFERYPITTSVLGALMLAFVVSLLTLIGREVRGYRQVSRFVGKVTPLSALAEETDRARVLAGLESHGACFSSGSFAEVCYRRFRHTLNDDMDPGEILALYQRTVQKAVEKRASEVLKKESMVAGSMSFISPNHLVQTLVILWTSLRTIRRIALVFGLRPATVGNWKLLKILAQNLAAQSIFDLATDEITNQISGSLSAKFVENSAEAVAAGALNVRLGKALIRLLKAD